VSVREILKSLKARPWICSEVRVLHLPRSVTVVPSWGISCTKRRPAPFCKGWPHCHGPPNLKICTELQSGHKLPVPAGTAWHAMSSVIATVTSYVCSVCDKGFGSAFISCVRHITSGRNNQCRDRGAQVMPVTSTVGRHDRNVGGRQSQAPRADRYSDQGSSNDSESDLEPGAGDPESGYSHISKRYPSYPHYISIKYPFHIHVISLHIQRYPTSYPVIEDMAFVIEDMAFGFYGF
jgi:hypothetical protein